MDGKMALGWAEIPEPSLVKEDLNVKEMFNRAESWRSRGERNIPAHHVNPYSTNSYGSES